MSIFINEKVILWLATSNPSIWVIKQKDHEFKDSLCYKKRREGEKKEGREGGRKKGRE
jgi:hypothetical protein